MAPTNQSPETPYYRTLKGYALDPGVSTKLNRMVVNEVVYKILWEQVDPGPVGEYLEVIDVDPASNCYYEPVDLNSTNVLAQDGLPPSEGNPQFYQQMVYAIIMKTIHHFEHALERKIIWRCHFVKNGSTEHKYERGYTPKLRIYPHAEVPEEQRDFILIPAEWCSPVCRRMLFDHTILAATLWR